MVAIRGIALLILIEKLQASLIQNCETKAAPLDR